MNYSISNDDFRNFKIPQNFNFFDAQIIDFVRQNFEQSANDKRSSSRNSFVFRDSFNHKIIVFPNTNTYMNNDDKNDKGGLYNFILNRIDNQFSVKKNPSNTEKRKTLIFIARFLNELGLKENIKPILKPKEKQVQQYSVIFKPLFNFNFLSSRGINFKTLNNPNFKGRILQGYLYDKKTKTTFKIANTAFPLYKNEKVVGAVLRNDNKFKSILGHHNFIWHSKLIEKPKSINIFESEIDALSFNQINKNPSDEIYISSHGTLYEKIFNAISTVLENYKNHNFITNLCFDNDFSGMKYRFDFLNFYLNKFDIDSQNLKSVKLIENKSSNNYSFDISFNNNYSIDEITNISKILNVKPLVFETKNEIFLKFQFEKFDISKTKQVFDLINFNHFNNLEIKSTYSKSKDWNDDLLNLKNTKKKSIKL